MDRNFGSQARFGLGLATSQHLRKACSSSGQRLPAAFAYRRKSRLTRARRESIDGTKLDAAPTIGHALEAAAGRASVLLRLVVVAVLLAFLGVLNVAVPGTAVR